MTALADTQNIDHSQLSPGAAVLTALAARLRQHARALANLTAKKTLGADMIRAADVLELVAAGDLENAPEAAAATAWLGRRGYAAFSGGRGQ